MAAFQVISLQLPDGLYRQLAEAAEAARQPLDRVVIQSIRVGLPPGVDSVPERFRADLRALNSLDDDVLWRIAQSDLDVDKAALYEQLLGKNQCGPLEPEEQAQLDILRDEADLLMLRRSFAYALLKWRGHRVPAVGELQPS